MLWPEQACVACFLLIPGCADGDCTEGLGSTLSFRPGELQHFLQCRPEEALLVCGKRLGAWFLQVVRGQLIGATPVRIQASVPSSLCGLLLYIPLRFSCKNVLGNNYSSVGINEMSLIPLPCSPCSLYYPKGERLPFACISRVGLQIA
uniref:Uncharacterized protein n=1 Tax=Micrurus lemniscatus lemniscatus TaxID=129467 RepID=A0A2D4H3W7_MICLE